MDANQGILKLLEMIQGSTKSLTIVLSPATEALVEVKCSCTVS
jgi:hypothetical protein